MLNQGQHFYEFGPFRLDPVKRRLLRDGEVVALTPKAFDTLLLLVEHSGRTVERDELMQQVWPDVAVEENNLTQIISALRRALGDRREEGRYIATISGQGYRFVAAVGRVPLAEAALAVTEHREARLVVDETAVQDEARPAEALDVPPVVATNGGRASPPASPLAQPAVESVIVTLRRHRKVAALVVALLLITAAALASWVYELLTPERREVAGSKLEVSLLTRTGTIGSAAISPDGKHIAYSVFDGGRVGLWLRQVAASSTQPIVAPAPVEYLGLTFSRDSNHLYFVRKEKYGAERALYRLPALGGVPTKLLAEVHSPIALSPDGRRLAFVRNSRDESVLMIANADGSGERRLAGRPLSDCFKVPAWSPDGEVIACSSGSGDNYDLHKSVIAVRVEDGEQRPASAQKWTWTRWVEWLADGSGLLITARDHSANPDQIWHIAYPGGAARRITSDSKAYLCISLTADAQTLAAVQTELHSDIWAVPDGDAARARKITSGTGSYGEVCYTPDGRIVYASLASGNVDIWAMNADGSGQQQLTADAGSNSQQTVSPDGRYIVFTSNRAGVFNIWRMDIDGGNPVRLSSGSGEKFPHCSPDGKWVVYNAVAPGQDRYVFWKVAMDGGEPVQLTDRNAERPVVSPDGRQIAYFQGDGSAGNEYQIAVMPFTGGPPERTFAIPKDLVPMPYVHWSADGQALTYAAVRDGITNVWAQPLGGGPPKQVTNFKVEGRFVFDWSRDGKHLVMTRRAWPADLVLLRNFAPGKP